MLARLAIAAATTLFGSAAAAPPSQATVATRDRGFSRFSGLRWLDPLAGLPSA